MGRVVVRSPTIDDLDEFIARMRASRKLHRPWITNMPETLEMSVMMSSVIPSAKYSCSLSPDMLSNGSTTIDGFSGSAGGASASRRTGAGRGSGPDSGSPVAATRYVRSGWAMFFT